MNHIINSWTRNLKFAACSLNRLPRTSVKSFPNGFDLFRCRPRSTACPVSLKSSMLQQMLVPMHCHEKKSCEFIHVSWQTACIYLNWVWRYSISLLAAFISDTVYYILILISQKNLFLFFNFLEFFELQEIFWHHTYREEFLLWCLFQSHPVL
jgi:hypothetical protein